MTAAHTIGDPAELAALYTAGAMPPDEHRTFEQHLAQGCTLCNQEVRALQGVTLGLAAACPPVDAPAHVAQQLMARIHADVAKEDRANADVANAESADPDAKSASPQVWRRWDSDPVDRDVIIRQAASSGWEDTSIEGIRIRRLSLDRARNQMTALVRMAAGTAYPAHIHNGPEECLVLEGDLRAGDEHFHAGDYQRMVPGTRHVVQSTDKGCLLLIVSSLTDELEHDD